MVLGWGLGAPNPPFVLFGPENDLFKLRFKGKMANFEAKNTVELGKNAKRTDGTHFTRVHPPVPPHEALYDNVNKLRGCHACRSAL